MVTVFTSVYNRCILMDRLYESLIQQTDNNFEWIIVDDGSTDGLNIKVTEWIRKTKDFRIKYVYIKNGGKHKAINLGVRISESEAFMIVDSDDYLTCDAVSFINKEFPRIADDDKFAGISGLKAFYSTGEIMGGIPGYKGYVDATNLERDKYNLLGDKAEVYKTSILKKYPFPEFEGENFCGEGVVFNKIGYEGYNIRWFTKVIYMAEYIEDGLSRNMFEKLRNNPKGWAVNLISQCEYQNWNDDKKFAMFFNFFERESGRLDEHGICSLLHIDRCYYQKMEGTKKKIRRNILETINSNGIKSLALYGMGTYARRLLLYLDELGIKVMYAIDRNHHNINYDCIYGLEDDLPRVDSVCITIKEKSIELEKMLGERFPDAFIWNFTDILDSLDC